MLVLDIIFRLLNPSATYTARSELELDIDNIMAVFNNN
jgi:hypothetical protein